MAADKLGRGLHHNVRSPLNGAGKNGRGTRIVDHQRHALFVGDTGEPFDIGNVELGIAQGFGVDGPGFLVNCPTQAIEIICIDKPDVNAEPGQSVVEEVVGFHRKEMWWRRSRLQSPPGS